MSIDKYTDNYTEILPNPGMPNEPQSLQVPERLHVLVDQMAKALKEAKEWQDYASEKLLEIRQLMNSQPSRRHNQPGTHTISSSPQRKVVSPEKSPSNNRDKTSSHLSTDAIPNDKSNSHFPHDAELSQLCEDYNEGMNLGHKQEFRQRHKPVRIGLINAMERRDDRRIVPVFQPASNGDFYAVKLKGNPFFAVVPRFDLTFTRAHFELGIFDCPGYNPKHRYRHVRVLTPALFEADSAKQRLTLHEKGELDLGQGE